MYKYCMIQYITYRVYNICYKAWPCDYDRLCGRPISVDVSGMRASDERLGVNFIQDHSLPSR